MLDFSQYPNESDQLLPRNDLFPKKRGLEQILPFVSDDLMGLRKAVTEVFSKHSP